MEIDRSRLYAPVDAARLIPSPRGGTISVKTLWRWIAAGKVQTVAMPNRRGHYIPGSEIARLLNVDEWPKIEGPTRAEAQKESERAREELRKMGLKV